VTRHVTNLTASVHQRLLNEAKATDRPFDEILQRFAIERFLYRLSKSRQSEHFVLKGALMLPVWSGPGSRPTRDIDLLGTIENSPEAVAEAMAEACEVDVERDGLLFAAGSVEARRITEDAEYSGVRVSLRATLGNARIKLQVDIGIGDSVFPAPSRIEYPTLLDFPAPELSGYPVESSIAEKFQAMVKLGLLNSRMKDFCDVWMLSGACDFKGDVLAEAIRRTFSRRGTPVTADSMVFDSKFARDSEKQTQWAAFVGRPGLEEAPGRFVDVAAVVASFLRPVARAIVEGSDFDLTWKAPGPWK
jgi:hypothetical protein